MSDHEKSHESSWPSEHKWELMTTMGILGAIGAVAGKRLYERYKESDRYQRAVEDSFMGVHPDGLFAADCPEAATDNL